MYSVTSAQMLQVLPHTCVSVATANVGKHNPVRVPSVTYAKLSSKARFSSLRTEQALSSGRASRSGSKVNSGFSVMALSEATVPITIQGKNVEVTDAIKEYAEEKIGHVVAPFEASASVREVDIKFSTSGGNAAHAGKAQAVEVTVYTKNGVFRAEEEESSIYAGIDLAADKVSRKLRKTKEKVQNKKGNLSTKEIADKLDGDFNVAAEEGVPEDEIFPKHFQTKSLTVEQAIEYLKVGDLSFYPFTNSKTGDELLFVQSQFLLTDDKFQFHPGVENF